MKNKPLIIGAIILAAALTFFIQRGGGTASLPVQSQLNIGTALVTDKTFYDFGTIGMNNGDVVVNFTVSNLTDKDIRIDSVVTSCMCTIAYLVKGEEKKGPFGMPGHGSIVPRANETIKAGEKWVVEVVFDPAAHGPLGAGRADRSVYLIDEKGGALELKFTAEVIL